MQFLSILGRQREPILTELEEKMLNLLETEYGVEAEDTNESEPQSENSHEPEQAPKVPLLKRPPIDDIPPSRDYNEIISLIDLHMEQLGWDKEYGRKFLNRTYGKWININLLMVSIMYNHRAIPLYFCLLTKKGIQ